MLYFCSETFGPLMKQYAARNPFEEVAVKVWMRDAIFNQIY